jgi:hypothetical protein
MVEKHKMIADFEQLVYTEKMLKQCWDEQIESFKTLVKAGWTDNRILDFMTWLAKTSHAAVLFPGSSMGTLLISKPKNGKLNYQQTLTIKFDNSSDLFSMEYSDWDLIEPEDDTKKAIQWNIKCSGIELAHRFIEFLEWNKSWSLGRK